MSQILKRRPTRDRRGSPPRLFGVDNIQQGRLSVSHEKVSQDKREINSLSCYPTN
jgi:hypothetical protein